MVRFRRHDKHGFDGQFLEMHARCTDYKCTAASTAAGFVNLQSGEDWTNGVADAEDTAFTIMLVMKTYQTPGDVNPMGVLHLANGGEKKGFGLYKIPSKCKPTLKSTIHSIALKLTGTSMSHIALKTDNWGLRSTKPGDYNGKYMHFKQAAVDAMTQHTFTDLVCKVEQYLIVGYVKTALTAAGITTVTLEGGAGKVSGWTPTNEAGAWPTIRFGLIGTAHAAGDKAITAAAASGSDTVLTIASTDFSTNRVAAGTPVYFATVVATEFYSVLVSGCTGTKLSTDTNNDLHSTTAIPANTVVEIIPGDGVNCKGDLGDGTGPFSRLSTLTAYYGADSEAAKANDDGAGANIAGCESECYEFGCDPDANQFGNPTKPLVGVLAADSGTGASVAFVIIEGGRGKYINGWPITQQGSTPAWGKIRFGSPDADLTGFPTAITITGVAVDGANTKLNFANTNFATAVPKGTKVFYALAGDDYYNDYYKNKCVKKFGSSRQYQDPDADFRIVTIRAQKKGTGQEAQVYIDGLHDGCESASTSSCTITAPMVFPANGDADGVTKQVLHALRVGLMVAVPADGTASSTASSRMAGALTNAYANVDIAEMLIYSAALSPEEMDRVGNYLSVKFNLPSFRLNTFIRSPTRAVAVSAHAGCDRVLQKGHQSEICDGYPGCTGMDEDTFVMSKRLADSDTDSYYVGMRLYITGGGDAKLSKTCGTGQSTAGVACAVNNVQDGCVVTSGSCQLETVKKTLSAAGQSCEITAYTASTRTATCDLTNSGKSGFVLWGGTPLGVPLKNRPAGGAFPCMDMTVHTGCHQDGLTPAQHFLYETATPTTNGADVTKILAVTKADTLLTVTWVPTYWKTPYYAAIGAPSADREIIKVLSVAVQGNRYQLTVIRDFQGLQTKNTRLASAKEITWSLARSLDVAATITYARSALMRNAAANDLNIVVAGFLASCGLDTTDVRCKFASDTLPLTPFPYTAAGSLHENPGFTGDDTSLGNLKFKITKQGSPVVSETRGIRTMRRAYWTLNTAITNVAGTLYDDLTLNIKALATGQTAPNAAPTALAAGDLLLLGSISNGEVVRVKSVTDASNIVVSRGHSLPTPMVGRATWTLSTAVTSDGQTSLVVTTAPGADLVADDLLLMGTIDTYVPTNSAAGLPTSTEVVKVTSVSGTTINVARGSGRLPDNSADTSGAGFKLAAYAVGTTLTKLNKAHAVDTVITWIGKDGEPLNVATLDKVAVQTAANGVVVDVAIVPLGGQTATGSDFVGGAGISTYRIDPCDVHLPPYITDAPIQIVQGQEYLKSPGAGFGGSFTADTRTTGNAFWADADGVTASSQTGPVTAPASGGTVLEIKGWYMAPADLIIDGAAANYNGADAKKVRGSTTERNENYLLATVGARPSECSDPTQTTPCADGKYTGREAALQCNIAETPSGSCADDWSRSCKCPHGIACGDCTFTSTGGAVTDGICNQRTSGTTWYHSAKPAIRCELPGTLNANQDLNIYWHGIKTTFNNWYRPHAPVVTQLVPSSARYSGGDTVTVMGSNFGPRSEWTAVNDADVKTPITRTATLSFLGKGMAKACEALVYVSDKQLICKVPALANQKQDMDKTARTVAVSVVVDAGGLRSKTDSSGVLLYSNVPTYFTCNSNEASETGKNACFSCCRSACIVDEFALGAQKGGATYSHCDTACYKFCGFNGK